MSLKAFHIFFIICSMILIDCLGAWQLKMYLNAGMKSMTALVLASFFFACGTAMAVYFVWFIRKIKAVGK